MTYVNLTMTSDVNICFPLNFLSNQKANLKSIYSFSCHMFDTSHRHLKQQHCLADYSGANLRFMERGAITREVDTNQVSEVRSRRSSSIFMRPSSLGGGRILRRTLSVRPSVRPSRYCYRASRRAT